MFSTFSFLGIVGCSDTSAEDLSGNELIELLSSENTPQFYDDEEVMEEYIKSNGLSSLVEVDPHNLKESTFWSMDTLNQDDKIQNFSFYLDRIDATLNELEALDFLHSFFNNNFLSNYDVEKYKYLHSSGRDVYVIEYKQKNLEQPIEEIPNVFTVSLGVEEDQVVSLRTSNKSPRVADIVETYDWDLPF